MISGTKIRRSTQWVRGKLAMTTLDRQEVVCHLCFQDKDVQALIKEEGKRGGVCPWCGRNGFFIPLSRLSENFREVASIYETVEGPDAFEHGDYISYLLDSDWGVFSEQIQRDDLAQELALSILYADLRPKEHFDYPDYEGFFRPKDAWLEDVWDEKAFAALDEKMPAPNRGDAIRIEGEIVEGLPDYMEVAFEDLATSLDEGTVLYRARVHKDRRRLDRFESHELGAPPPAVASAGRANRKGKPVLYLSSDYPTALAEVRAWKGAAVALAEVRIRRGLFVVDLSEQELLGSPFFVELLAWKIELAVLLRRLGEDMSRPVVAHEDEVLYKPTQLLAWLIQSSGYDGCIYPSAMGPDTNIVLFNPDDAEITNVSYERVNRVEYRSEPLSPYDDVYEEGPYDSLS